MVVRKIKNGRMKANEESKEGNRRKVKINERQKGKNKHKKRT